MKKTFVVLAAVFLFLSGCAKVDLNKYQHLKESKISTKTRQKMIVVELKGDPNETSGRVISALYKTYYGLDRETRGKGPAALHARWTNVVDPETDSLTPKNDWIGIFGLPVPEAIATLPEKKEVTELGITLDYWEYGEVAEILHLGPYSEEDLTIGKLYNFIEDQGYKVAGAHEEVYLKGPGRLLRGNPNNYQTIIRYSVKKR